MKALLFGLLLTTTVAKAGALTPKIKDTVIVGYGWGMSEFFGHYGALKAARKEAQRSMKKRCNETHGASACSKKNFQIDDFTAKSIESGECGGSIRSRCNYGDSSYVGSLKNQPKIKNILLKTEITKIEQGKCLVQERSVVSWVNIYTQSTYGAVLNPELSITENRREFEITNFDELIEGSEFKSEPRKIQEHKRVYFNAGEEIDEEATCAELRSQLEALPLTDKYEHDYENTNTHKVINF